MLHIGRLLTPNAAAAAVVCRRVVPEASPAALPAQRNSNRTPPNDTVPHGARSIHTDSFISSRLAQLCIFVLLLWHSIFVKQHFEPFGYELWIERQERHFFPRRDTFRYRILVTVASSHVSNLFYLFIRQRETPPPRLSLQVLAPCGPAHFRDPNILVSVCIF